MEKVIMAYNDSVDLVLLAVRNILYVVALISNLGCIMYIKF